MLAGSDGAPGAPNEIRGPAGPTLVTRDHLAEAIQRVETFKVVLDLREVPWSRCAVSCGLIEYVAIQTFFFPVHARALVETSLSAHLYVIGNLTLDH